MDQCRFDGVRVLSTQECKGRRSMNRPTASPLPAHDVPDRTRTEHQVPHLRLDAQDQEFVPLESAIQALLVQLLLRRPEADLLMPVVGNPLARRSLRSCGRSRRNASSAHKMRGETPAGGRSSEGGCSTDRPPGSVESFCPIRFSSTFRMALAASPFGNLRIRVFSHPTSRGVRHQPQSHRFSEGAGLPSHGFLLVRAEKGSGRKGVRTVKTIVWAYLLEEPGVIYTPQTYHNRHRSRMRCLRQVRDCTVMDRRSGSSHQSRLLSRRAGSPSRGSRGAARTASCA